MKERGAYKANRKQIAKMAYINPTLSVVSLNVNGLNTPIKRQIGKMDFKKPKQP